MCVELPRELNLTKMEIISLAQSGFYVRKTSATIKYPFFDVGVPKTILTTKIL